MTDGAPRQLPRFRATLGDSDRTGRLGVAYVRALCAQAGIGSEENPPGEDVLAIDLTVNFREAGIRVQVKTGTMAPASDGSLRPSVREDWIDKWRANCLPAYLVYVRLPLGNYESLIDHLDDGTLMRAHAYWARVDKLSASPVSLLPERRMTIDTFDEWQQDILDRFAASEEGEVA